MVHPVGAYGQAPVLGPTVGRCGMPGVVVAAVRKDTWEQEVAVLEQRHSLSIHTGRESNIVTSFRP